jgi:four helix bundle protein
VQKNHPKFGYWKKQPPLHREKQQAFKDNISLKEAYETEYWLELLYKTEYISEKEYNSIFPECRELTNILSQIILTAKSKDIEEK